MNEYSDPNAGSLRKRETPPPDEVYSAGPYEPREEPSQPRAHSRASKPFDAWVAMDILARRWAWLLVCLLLGAGGFFYLGWYLIKPKFTATAQLLRYETPEFFKSSQLTPETFAGLIRSPVLLRNVGDEARPHVTPERLVKCIKIDPQPDSDLVKVTLSASEPEEAVDLLNLYIRHAVDFTREMQTSQAAKVANDYLTKQVNKMNDDIDDLHTKFRTMAPSSPLAGKVAEVSGNLNALTTNLIAARPAQLMIDKLTERLNKSLSELAELQQQYTDIHPSVIRQKEEIDSINKDLADVAAKSGVSNQSPAALATAGPRPANTVDPETDIVRMRLLSLEEGHVNLVTKLREAQLYASNPPGMATIFAPATLRTVASNLRWFKVTIASGFGGFLGLGLGLVMIILAEVSDHRLRGTDDLKRVTNLPVLTTVGDLSRMDEHQRAQWAFRTWTILQGRLSPSSNHGLVCGITSSAAGEGRSTWISLLADAASQTGFRVLTIATKPSPTHVSPDGEDYEQPPEEEQPINMPDAPEHAAGDPNSALVGNVLTSPAKVTEQLTGANSQPVVHIPLPGWVWNLERRKQWREALNHWRKIENLVILVELPPASVSEAVLLGSNLPNLLWLAENGCADAAETREQLEVLRHARCNLIGAVLNRQGSTPFRKRFPRWLGCVPLLLAASLLAASSQDAQPPSAQTVPAAPPGQPDTTIATNSPEPVAASAPLSTNHAFSVVSPAQRAAWQQHLTLGAGDVLNLGLYGKPELSQSDVSIGPDGRISYLQAQDVVATGLTVDELRARLDKALSEYRRAPRSIVTPVAFRSKRYYMLGKVMTKGVYILDRPITVLEAIARAHGLENGLVDRNVIDLADFQRSFLARGGKRYPLNFEKLFQEGDLSQNIPIEPGDYIYFPSTSAKEVYVLGEVRLPGPVIYNPDTTIIAAISARGGYTDRAYKARVLVVRGSLNNPEAIAVDTHAILDGRSVNFKLQPRDIIFVNSRPFIRVEELADLAATAFIQSLITTWVGVDVVKPINQ